MKISTNSKFKRLLCILVCLLMAATLFLFAACNANKNSADNSGDNGNDNTTDQTTTDDTTDNEVIKNGNFNLYNDTTATVFPVTPRSWSYAADSSTGSSAPISSGDYTRYGIISVQDSNYNADTSIFKTSNMKDPLPNPGAPSEQGYDPSKDVSDTNNDKVLMLENIKATAAKYKSSSITIPQNSYALISVYVNTYFVDNNGDQFVDPSGLLPGQGATIALSGGVNYPVILTGIFTDPATDGGWAEYQFIIEGSNMSSKTVNLELGLGTGGPADSQGYTEGFAFFSKAVLTFINQKDFNNYNYADVSHITDDGFYLKQITYNDFNSVGTLNSYKEVQENLKNVRLAFSFNYSFNDPNGNENLSNTSYFDIINPDKDGTPYDANNYSVYQGDYKSAPNFYNDALGYDAGSGEYSYPFTDGNIIAVEKMNDTNTSIGLTKDDFLPVSQGQYYKISFWLKTSELPRGSVNVYLTYYEIDPDGLGGYVVTPNLKQFTAIDTTNYNLSSDDKASVYNGDKYDDWRQYTFYVDGGLFSFGNAPKQLSLEIWFGSVNINDPTIIDDGVNPITLKMNRDLIGLKTKDFPGKDSFMMLSNLNVTSLSSFAYGQAQSGDNTVTGFSLSDQIPSSPQIANGSFNTPAAFAYKDDMLQYDSPLAPSGFTLMYGLGYDANLSQLNALNNAPQTYGSVTSGIINTNLCDNYLNNPAMSMILTTLITAPVTMEKLEAYFNTFSGQTWNSVLMICNQISTAFGYYTPFKTLSANSLYEFTVQVKTASLTGAGASIYLVDQNGDRFSNYVLDDSGNKVLPTASNTLVYNPFYDEKYDESSDNYNPEAGYDKTTAENQLLRKGTKLVQANTIPTLNPYYDKNYDKEPTWKHETTKYYVLKNDTFNDANSDLYFIINNYSYDQKAQFTGIKDAGFTTYAFIIKTGYQSLNVKLELWNGQRYLQEGDDYTQVNVNKTYSQGYAFFDNAILKTLDQDQYYNYLFEGTNGYPGVEDNIYNFDTAHTMIFDVAAFNPMADPGAPTEADTVTPTTPTTKTPFDWGQLTMIILAAAVLFALIAIVVKKFLDKKKVEETTVTEAPSYKRTTSAKTTTPAKPTNTKSNNKENKK